MRRLTPFFLALCLLSSGCGFKKATQEAETTVANHFQAIATNGFEAAATDYGELFYTKIDKVKWVNMMKSTCASVGDFKNYDITGWRVTKTDDPATTGLLVELRCRVVYSKMNTREVFKLTKAKADKDYKIIAHSIASSTNSAN